MLTCSGCRVASRTTHNAIIVLQVLIKSRALSAECLLGLTALSAECTQVRKICCALSAECTPELRVMSAVQSAVVHCVWSWNFEASQQQQLHV